jgi:hypothetical protein
MPAPEVVIPLLEGHVGSIANGGEGAALFVKMCKEVMLATVHKDQTDWTFVNISDIDETSAATATAPETGAVLYGMLIGYVNATTTDEAIVAVCDDADGTIAAFAAGDTRVTDDPKVQIKLQAAATEGTEELWPYLFPRGIPFASYMSFVADGEDGTNPATGDIRAWILYRTGTTILI